MSVRDGVAETTPIAKLAFPGKTRNDRARRNDETHGNHGMDSARDDDPLHDFHCVDFWDISCTGRERSTNHQSRRRFGTAVFRQCRTALVREADGHQAAFQHLYACRIFLDRTQPRGHGNRPRWLVRAVIETESNWNPRAYSHKGAGGLMQLIPTTAQKYGAYDLFDPQQNIDAGVKHLKWLLERYNGNLDLALAAYNAGEGAVDRVHGVPAYRETRNYVQRVQNAYFRPGSGRMADAFINSRAIHRDVTADGHTVYSNE